MKAIVCEKLGMPEDLILKDIPERNPNPDEIAIQVKACAVNFPDTLIIQGKYQIKPELPFSPGSDISGIVTKVGSEISKFKVGDEIFGVLPYGGFSEEVVTKPKNIFPKPKGMSFPIAASFLYAYGTSLHAIKDRAQLQSGETIVIMGAAGGVGLAAVDIAHKMGARVIACASTQEKLDVCKEYGATDFINYTTEDLKNRIKELTDGKGADVVYDPVGGDYSEQALRGLAWKGRYLVVGFASGEIPKIPLNLALLKGCQIVGVFWGRFIKEEPSNSLNNSLQIMQWYNDGEIKPHIHKLFALSEVPLALREMMDRKVKGKVIIEVG
ncbi:NADPH:quinone oxidoreductase family protein [Saprospiraceae bacterium]|nr:NADPH:quinone oxidoreductase family protein [Saprospiraceae bacterium]